MRVKWQQCVTTDPDVPTEFAFVERKGVVLGTVRALFGADLVVACDDGIVRKVDVDVVKVEEHKDANT